MTELNQKNREIFLDFCKNTWDFDDESMSYIEHRTSDDWEPVPEFKELFNSNVKYEDQRIIYDVDLTDPTVSELFSESDEAYAKFKSIFMYAIDCLESNYGCTITYGDFLKNKVMFKKNLTKIKKVFETVYAENNYCFERDFSYREYTKEYCAEKIVKAFEVIGASKKSEKKYQLVISFNVMDWFLSSTGGKISSCFNLDNTRGYCFCLGIPFLSGDKNRMMIYISDGSRKQWQGFDLDSPITRTWCILDKTNIFNIIKWYPNNTVGISPVNSITGVDKFKSSESFSEGKYPIDVLSTKKGMVSSVYNDVGRWVVKNDKLYHSGKETRCGQQIFTKNLISCEGKNTTFCWSEPPSIGKINFGYKIPLWRKFGISVDSTICTYKCSCCGENKGGFLLDNTDVEFLCYDCYKENVFVCSVCGKEHKKEEVFELYNVNDEKVKVCKSCYDNISDSICDCCGKLEVGTLKKTKDGKKVCGVCISKREYVKCSSCNSYVKDATVYFDTASKTSTEVCDCCNEGYKFSIRATAYNKPIKVFSKRIRDVRTTE